MPQSGRRDPVPVSEGLSEEFQRLQAQAYRLAQIAATRSEPPARDWNSGEGRAKLRQELVWARVPEKYASSEWSKCRVRKAGEEYASNLAEYVDQGRGLILMGGIGTGKSSLAALICGEAIKHGLSVHWTYVPELLDQLSDRQTQREVLKKSVSAKIEVWDDFGVGGVQGWQMGLLDRIVERRYQRNLPMLVTTNLGKKSLVENASSDLQRLVDRWREKGFVLTLAGESMRRTWRDGEA